MFVPLRIEIAACLVALASACAPLASPRPASAAEAAPEVRGTWVTTTANDAIANPANTARTMARLRDIGLNTVYVETWKNGYTQFPSETLRETIGLERKPDLLPAHNPALSAPRDLLEETLIQAHRHGLIYVAWFEYGFMAAYKDSDTHLRRMKPEWLTRTRDGSLVSDQNPFVWMNPLHPEARDFLMGIVLDAVDRYDLDGVQLDDRIAWPVTMGYDDYTKKVYAAEHGGALPPDDARDPAWVKWRADKVTEFAERFYRELKAKRPNLLVSISPAVYPWSLENYACDWKRWSHAGWMDEYVPQVYRMNYERYAQDWPVQLDAAGPGRAGDLISGIRVVGDGPDTTWPDLEKKVLLPRETGAGGHVHWFSRGVLEVYPEQLTSLYDVASNGPAAHPKFGADWRPAPVVGRSVGGGRFAFDVRDAGRYRVIARSGDVWREVESRSFEAGEAALELEGAEAAELLVDRRDAPVKAALAAE